MREAYAHASEILQTTKLHRENGAQIRREIRSAAMIAVGYGDDEIRQLDLDRLTAEEFSDALRRRLQPEHPRKAQEAQFMVVKETELRGYVNGGNWQPEKRLATGEWLIVSRPIGPTPSRAQ